MASCHHLLLFLFVVLVVAALSSPAEDVHDREKRNIAAWQGLLDNVNESVKDMLQQIGDFVSGGNSLPSMIVAIIKDGIKILGGVVEALRKILGFNSQS